MKKILSLIFVVGIVMGIAGCGEPAPGQSNTNIAPEKETVKAGETQGAVTPSDVSTD